MTTSTLPPLLSERQKAILAAVSERQSAALRELAPSLQISESTLRREVSELARLGLLQRQHGRVSLAFSSAGDAPVRLRTTFNAEEKQRIARAALELIRNGETIFVLGGSTTLELARLLPGQRQVTVLTNALLVANAVVDRPGIKLVVLGGVVREDEQTMHGHLTLYAAEQLHADKIFYGIEAISLEHGLTHSQLVEVSTDRALLKAANQTIVLADHTKFNRLAPARVVPLNEVDILITGREAPPETVLALQQAGVQVILA